MSSRLCSCANPTRWFLFWIAVGLCSVFLLGGAAHARKATFALQSARGRVEIQTGGKGAWKALPRGVREASAGDRIRTGPGSSVSACPKATASSSCTLPVTIG